MYEIGCKVKVPDEWVNALNAIALRTNKPADEVVVRLMVAGLQAGIQSHRGNTCPACKGSGYVERAAES